MKYIFALVVLRFIDLFGGIGGFRLGLEKANQRFRCVWYCDNNKYAVQVYNKKFKENYMPTDIREVETRSIPDFDLLCAGFPCQSFSVAGKRKGFKDTRGNMFFEIARIAKQKQPRILFLENVKGLLSHDKGKTFAVILNTLDELGYDCEWQVLNSKDFGVPQNRERVFIIGYFRGTSRPKVFPIRCDAGEVSKISRIGTCQPEHPNNYNVFAIDGVSPTLSSAGDGHWGQSILPFCKACGSIRRLTPVECERLQSFPDNWTRYGTDENGETVEISDTQRYRMCGNAVTCNVVEAIGNLV